MAQLFRIDDNYNDDDDDDDAREYHKRQCRSIDSTNAQRKSSG